MSELFFEILSGEIPAQMQSPAREQLKDFLEKFFQESGMPFSSVETFVSPRRLVAVVQGLPQEQQDRSEERRGPRIPCDPKALQGFLTSTGLAEKDLQIQETPKGSFYFANLTVKGQKTLDLIPGLMEHLIDDFSWPKRMTWGTTKRSWIRPIYSILCLFDGQIVPHTLSLSEPNSAQPVDLPFTNKTVGHRFLAPEEFTVSNFKDYTDKLLKAHVVIDQDQRKTMIQEQLDGICKTNKLTWQHDEGLLNEVVGLVEWPNLMLGHIDEKFMFLPPELLIITMRVHQRYFALRDAQGKLAPYFIIPANTIPADDGSKMIQGNERVLRARFEDGAFYYHLDQEMSLLDHAKSLDKMMFHALLGNLADKSKRLESLVAALTKDPQVLKNLVLAAQISKADLTCHLVSEFPELQGIIGSYYAADQGHPVEVVQALYAQYQPKGPQDSLPQGDVPTLLALADRVDTLVGFFAVGIKPTGSKDPFALRRTALAIIRLLENQYGFALEPIIKKTYDLYAPLIKDLKETKSVADTLNDLENFMMDRLKVYWRDQGYRHDAIAAILSEGLFNTPLKTLKDRLEALKSFLEESSVSQDLLAAYRRADNILKQDKESGSKTTVNGAVKDLMAHDDERALFDALKTQEPIIADHFEHHRYQEALEQLAPLREKIDAFFQAVLVNDPDPKVRQNRLSLLSQFISTLNKVADFSKIEG